MSFEIVRNDITRVAADAIVNTANPRPVIGGGTDNAIYTAAGKEQLLAERRKLGDIARGEARATSAFALQAKYIIHTVGPVWLDGSQGEEDTLRACYENSLQLAVNLKCRSIAFPLISTGTYGFPKDLALNIAADVIGKFLEENDMRVILVVFDRKAVELSGSLADSIREYIDANYVREARMREYDIDYAPNYSARLKPDRDTGGIHQKKFGRERNEYGAAHVQLSECMPMPAPQEKCKPTAPQPPVCAQKAPKFPHPGDPTAEIAELLKNQQKTFQEKLFELMNERKLSPPEVYKNYISKQVFHKILSDKDYHPNKFTAIALCLSLHLDEFETKDLLARAGWALSPSSVSDLIVVACIRNHEYNLVKIDLILDQYGCNLLDKIK